MKKINLIFFGSHPWFSLPVLQTLIKSSQIKLLLWVTKPGLINSLNVKPPVRAIIDTHLTDIKTKILANVHQIPDINLLLAGYGPPFLDQDILQLPPKGCLNLHPSLLPQYPGASPVHQALKNNDQTTGVTLIKMIKKIDQGPIVAQQKFPIHPQHNLQTLTQDLGKCGAKLYLKSIKKYLNDQIKLKKQSSIPKQTYTQKLSKKSGKINWQLSPQQIHNFIRSVTPWPGAWTPYQNQPLKIIKTHLSKNQLIIDTIQLSGKSPIFYHQFLVGHPDFHLPASSA